MKRILHFAQAGNLRRFSCRIRKPFDAYLGLTQGVGEACTLTNSVGDIWVNIQLCKLGTDLKFGGAAWQPNKEFKAVITNTFQFTIVRTDVKQASIILSPEILTI